MRWGRGSRGVRVAGALAACVALVSICAATPVSAGFLREAKVLFTIDVARITESSSLAVSTEHAGLVYTTNDSGDGPFVYVLDLRGELVGTTTLSGVDPVDIEALSAGRDGSLVIGDIGDNNGLRSSVPIYRIPQPTAGDHTVTPEKVSLTYPDGPRNAESLVYVAASGRVVIVSKELTGHVYRSPPYVFSHPTAALNQVADAPMMSTDATLLRGGAALAVRTYRDAVIYHYPSFAYWADLDLPTQQMGESLAAVPGRGVVYAGSEGVSSPVWIVPLPDLGAPRPRAGATSETPPPGHPTPAALHPAASGLADSPVVVSVAEDRSGLSPIAVGATTGVLVTVVGSAVLLTRRRRLSRAPSD